MNNVFETLVEALEQLTEAWRRGEIGCPDPMDAIIADEEPSAEEGG